MPFKPPFDTLNIGEIENILTKSPKIELDRNNNCPIMYLLKTFDLNGHIDDIPIFEQILKLLFDYYCDINYYNTLENIKKLDSVLYDSKYKSLFVMDYIAIKEYYISCPICFDDIKISQLQLIICGHCFCNNCIAKIKICSICKREIKKIN